MNNYEDPKNARGVVKRGVTNVLTPGTAIDASARDQGELAYFVGISSEGGDIALCALDLATATFKVTSSTSEEKIIQEIARIEPKELVIFRNDAQAVKLSELLFNELKAYKDASYRKTRHLTNFIK